MDQGRHSAQSGESFHVAAKCWFAVPLALLHFSLRDVLEARRHPQQLLRTTRCIHTKVSATSLQQTLEVPRIFPSGVSCSVQPKSHFGINYPNFSGSADISSEISGAYSADNGYLLLTASGQVPTQIPAAEAQGYALVLSGEAALLRPGNSTFAPVITADMDSCPIVQNGETFLFVALPGTSWIATTTAAYGSVKASTDATGGTWSFSSHSQSLLAGSGSAPSYPASFTGSCGQGINEFNVGYSISVFPTPTTPSFAPTIAVSPSGFFAESENRPGDHERH